MDNTWLKTEIPSSGCLQQCCSVCNLHMQSSLVLCCLNSLRNNNAIPSTADCYASILCTTESYHLRPRITIAIVFRLSSSIPRMHHLYCPPVIVNVKYKIASANCHCNCYIKTADACKRLQYGFGH